MLDLLRQLENLAEFSMLDDSMHSLETMHSDSDSLLRFGGGGVESVDKNGWTALHLACYLNRIEIAQVLILKGNAAEFARVGDTGMTPMHIACSRGHVEIISLLVTEGCSTSCFSPGFKVF